MKTISLLYRLVNSIKAFSLIELMLVVAISAAISAVAIPNYKDYVNKAKVAEMISTIDSCQTQIYQFFLKNGSFPDGSANQQVICQGQRLSSSSITLRGKISASYSATTTYSQFIVTNSDLHASSSTTPYNLYIRLTIDSSGDIKYSCGWPSSESNGVPLSIMPSSCTNNIT